MNQATHYFKALPYGWAQNPHRQMYETFSGRAKPKIWKTIAGAQKMKDLLYSGMNSDTWSYVITIVKSSDIDQ